MGFVLTIVWANYVGPVGNLRLAALEDGALFRLEFMQGDVAPDDSWTRNDEALDPVARQLDEYFSGTRMYFDLVLAPQGTPFQLEVWMALRSILYGQTISYGEQAARINRPSAGRAVGGANGRNPLAIVVPCHRVIGSDGSLTGFGGGMDWKRYLLGFEEANAARLVAR